MYKRKLTYWFVLLFLTGGIIWAQKKPARVWVTTKFNKKTVMVGEPLVVTVTAYTSTWFTDPPVFEEIQVKGAIMVRLQERTGATTVNIGRKQYPAIKQKFVVYPNIIGKNILPSFEVKISCPPEGDYKGVERIIRTKEQSFTVEGPPDGMDPSNWLGAYNVTLSEVWDRPLTNLKAGDLLERRITIRAQGALAAAIPAVQIATPDFGSVYPRQPILGNRQNSSSFSGTRTEIISYLLEKDGNYTIPEIVLKWFDFKTKDLKTLVLDSIPVEIAPNPDLAFILSRQKALQEELAKELPPEVIEEEPFEYMGLNWWQWLLVVLAGISGIAFLIRLLKNIRISQEERKRQHLLSEEHYFQLFKKACEQGELNDIIRQFHQWYDRFRTGRFGPESKVFFRSSEDESLASIASEISELAYNKEKTGLPFNRGNEVFILVAKARKKVMRSKMESDAEAWLDLNPKIL